MLYSLHAYVTPPHVCTEEAKQCPDGSYVGRTGPDCAFAACPVPGIQKGKGTLQGTITIGPICPFEQAGHPCNPTPQMYAAHQVFVYDSTHTKLVETLTPDAQGHFSGSLEEGTYYVDVHHQGVGSVRGAPATIEIVTGQTAMIAIDVDTGIR